MARWRWDGPDLYYGNMATKSLGGGMLVQQIHGEGRRRYWGWTAYAWRRGRESKGRVFKSEEAARRYVENWIEKDKEKRGDPYRA